MTDQDAENPKAARLARNLWRMAKRRAAHAFRLQKGLATPANTNSPLAGGDQSDGESAIARNQQASNDPQSFSDLMAKIAEELEDEPADETSPQKGSDTPAPKK